VQLLLHTADPSLSGLTTLSTRVISRFSFSFRRGLSSVDSRIEVQLQFFVGTLRGHLMVTGAECLVTNFDATVGSDPAGSCFADGLLRLRQTAGVFGCPRLRQELAGR
jgi:hypothetical protein